MVDISNVIAAFSSCNTEVHVVNLNTFIRVVNNDMSDHRLSLALSKTEIVFLASKRSNNIVPLILENMSFRQCSHFCLDMWHFLLFIYNTELFRFPYKGQEPNTLSSLTFHFVSITVYVGEATNLSAIKIIKSRLYIWSNS